MLRAMGHLSMQVLLLLVGDAVSHRSSIDVSSIGCQSAGSCYVILLNYSIFNIYCVWSKRINQLLVEVNVFVSLPSKI